MTTLHLPAVSSWTIDDLEDLPPDLRYEIHNGNLVIMSPARLWHQEVAAEIRSVLRGAGRQAFTEVGVRRTKGDTRVPDVAVFDREPEDPNASWHDPDKLALVVEVWSPSSDEKDHHDMQWYAERGIPEYWLAQPVGGDKWGAFITRYKLARATSGEVAYVKVEATTLGALKAETPGSSDYAG